MSRRKKWIVIIIAIVVVVGIAVGGGVGGSLAVRNQAANANNDNSNDNSNGGSNTPPQSPSPNAGGTALGSSALAAVNYTIDGTDYRMVLWQPRKNDTDIVYSLLDSSQQPAEGWKTISISSKLAEGAVEAKPGTAIAAVLRPRIGGTQHALSVYYLSASSVIQEVRTNDARGAKWEKVAHSVTAAQNSQLAGRWDVCGNSKCSNLTALVYETERNEQAWYWPGLTDKSPLEKLTVSFKSKIIPGSGLSLAMTMDPGPDGNTAEQNLKLYYQNATAKSLWEITRNVNSTYFITQTKLATNLPERNPSQIYATSFYRDSPAQYVFIVMRAADGTLQALHWNLDTWRLPRDPVYRNAPADVGNKFGAVSVTNDMRVYALTQDGNDVHIFNADKIDPITWTYETKFQLS